MVILIHFQSFKIQCVFLFLLLDVQRLILDQFKLNVSVTTVKRARKKLGWVKSGVKYCQLVKDKNTIERLAFATNCQTNNDKFDNVTFTDELLIWLEQHAKLCFRRSHEAPKTEAKSEASSQGAHLGRYFKTWNDRHGYIRRKHV